ncbi:hypothetical protein [Flagellimonas iocasae]|uniref:Phage abortive infection protein n=1 Tax=Flagellimonas iocasae TaxID=2055905 RepID=A0ABW4Y0N6_9FLAO
MRENKNIKITINRRLLYLLIVYLLFIVFSPIIFAKITGWVSFDERSGVIGDTIGGITAPFINLLAAFLVFISFREQIRANKLLNKENRFNYITNFFNMVKEEVYENNLDQRFQVKHSYHIDNWIRLYYNRDRFLKNVEGSYSTEVDDGHKYPDDRVKDIINENVRNSIFNIVGQSSAIVKLIEEIKSSDLEEGVRSFYFHQIIKMVEYTNFALLYELFKDQLCKEIEILDVNNLGNYGLITANLKKLLDWDYLYFNQRSNH